MEPKKERKLRRKLRIYLRHNPKTNGNYHHYQITLLFNLLSSFLLVLLTTFSLSSITFVFFLLILLKNKIKYLHPEPLRTGPSFAHIVAVQVELKDQISETIHKPIKNYNLPNEYRLWSWWIQEKELFSTIGLIS